MENSRVRKIGEAFGYAYDLPTMSKCLGQGELLAKRLCSRLRRRVAIVQDAIMKGFYSLTLFRLSLAATS
jgi:hypothetical protein